MTKLNRTFCAVALIAFTLLSCNDDDASPKENPLASYLLNAGFSQVNSNIDGGNYEFGISFIPKVSGKITDVVVKLPDDATNLRVTIWDVETEEVLRTETVPSVNADEALIYPIDPLALTKDKEYMITFNSNDWYNHVHPEGADATYPVEAGNFQITGYAYIGTTNQTIPTAFQTDYYAGDLSFRFQKN